MGQEQNLPSNGYLMKEHCAVKIVNKVVVSRPMAGAVCGQYLQKLPE
jgi:hypothetical protein